ncbi:Hypothetical leucine rich repeat and MORN motif protein [Ectocarpus siliculosus]|uniref:Hypothetical leucine rich repeat and MORN motif protein n=1 Tax=Ectocarpus siliculosus TaxID=2880 RepID=D8LGB3_ECTSI|nr:Hypothetical leucine rich repeat and MORN motif protein [Ectocarpus siliculosus]|eukprot:CBN79012.1 Hypothetical leucine rich repeat and MORN motif protein [Ectocarpus siliculosus]
MQRPVRQRSGSFGAEDEQPELWLSGSKASRNGWVRVSDATERVFYHSIESGKITLERPAEFGDDDPAWADGTELCMYRGKCSRCKEFIPRSETGPVALAADRGQVALSFLLCRPCLNWLMESAKLEREGLPPLSPCPPPPPAQKPVFGRGGGGDGGGLGKTGKSAAASTPPPRPTRKQLMKVYKDVDPRGMGDLLSSSRLARSYAKCMYSCLSEQSLRPGRFDDQRSECLKAKAAAVVAGEGRRRAAREIQMKLRCISQHKSNGAGDYLCWFSPEGRVDYFGQTSGGRAHGWGLAEYQDGSWCLSTFSHGQQHTPPGGKLSTIAYGNGIRYHGEMKQGKPNGMGTKTWPDESEYVGEFNFGKEHGEGTKRFPDGSEHSGKWRAGNRDGPGVFIDARGQKTVGNFRDDAFGKAEEDGIVAPAKADITVESGQHDPETLLDLAISNLAVVTDRQPSLNKASVLMAKMPLHLHPLVAEAFASSARALTPGFRSVLPSFAWRTLSELATIACKLIGEAVGPIADAIATSQTLQEVDLSWNPIRRGGARLIIAALETSAHLRRLNLAGCQLGVDGGQAMIAAIGSGRDKFRLVDLDLASNSLGAGCGDPLAVALRRNKTLTRLSVRANGLGPEGGTALAAGLASNCGILKQVVVADNRLGPRVATLVAATMRGGTSECLRGFGYRPAPALSELQQQPSDHLHATAPPFEKGADTDQSIPGSPGPSQRYSGENSCGSNPRVAAASMRESLSSLQRTSALEPSTARGRLNSTAPTTTVGAAGGTMGPGTNDLEVLTRNNSSPITATAAIEEDLGRPQTAGTASG